MGRNRTSDVNSRTYFPRSQGNHSFSLDIVSNYQLCSRFLAKEMPTICVATGCSNQNDDAQGISLHVIPVFMGHRRQAKRRRKKWIDFVKQKRAISRREICERAVAFLFNRMMETN